MCVSRVDFSKILSLIQTCPSFGMVLATSNINHIAIFAVFRYLDLGALFWILANSWRDEASSVFMQAKSGLS